MNVQASIDRVAEEWFSKRQASKSLDRTAGTLYLHLRQAYDLGIEEFTGGSNAGKQFEAALQAAGKVVTQMRSRREWLDGPSARRLRELVEHLSNASYWAGQ